MNKSPKNPNVVIQLMRNEIIANIQQKIQRVMLYPLTGNDILSIPIFTLKKKIRIAAIIKNNITL